MLLLTLLLAVAHSQQPAPLSLPLSSSTTATLPPLSPFANHTLRIAPTTAVESTLLLDLLIPSRPPHSVGLPRLLFLAAINENPSPPNLRLPNCSPTSPCLPPISDSVAFYTQADRHFLAVRMPPTAVLHLSVLNIDNVDMSVTTMLHARRVGTATPACPGAAMDDQCRRRGNCQRNDNAWRCICSAGWAGRDCAVKIESWPNVVPRPIWDGSINPLLNSAVVTIGETGRAFLWRGLGKNRVVFRARVLQGRVEVAGNVTQVGASGGIVQLFAKLRGSNEGDGLEFGTDVATVYDQRARGTVVVQRKGENEEFYELVVVSREAVDEGVWMVALFVTGGEAVVSLRARKCGGDLLECPFGNDEGKFPVGVALAVSAVAIIMFVVLGLLYMCLRKRKGSHKRSEVAWEGVALPVNDTVMTNKERVNADVDRSSTVKSDLTFLNVEKRHEEQSSMTRSDDTAQKLDSKGIVERRVHQFQQGAGGGQTPLEEAHEEMREEMRDTEWTQRVQWEMAQSNARVRDAWAREARMENGDSLHI